MDTWTLRLGQQIRQRIFPFTRWLGEVTLVTFRQDLFAGLTVAVVLIPQSMAYAMLAGLPPLYGLYAAATTPAIAAFWGSLRQLATGPIAIMSLLVYTTLSPIAEPGSSRFIELAFLLTLMVGLIYIIVGGLSMGIIMSFISHSTVRGFTASVSLIIIATQLPHLLGVSVSRHEDLIGFLIELASKLPEVHMPTLAIGASAFIMIHSIKKALPNFPAALVALVLATLAVRFLSLDQLGVAIIGAVPAGLPHFHVPALDLDTFTLLLGPAIVIALVSFAETYSVGKAISEKTKQKVDVNQEFFGQGLANLFGAFFQSYPVSGSFSRTAMNYAAGGRTGLSSAISCVVVVATLLFLTPLLTDIPRAALAALVISAVMLLFHPGEVFTLWKKNRHDGVVATTVFVLALIVKPDYALLIGIIVSLVLFLWVSMHPRVIRMAWDPVQEAYLNVEGGNVSECRQMLILRIDNAIYFANAEYTVDQLLEMVNTHAAPPRYVLLDFKAVAFIDITGVDELRRFMDELRARGIVMIIVSLHRPVRQVFSSSGFLREIGEDAIFTSYHGTIDSIRDKLDHSACGKKCPGTEIG